MGRVALRVALASYQPRVVLRGRLQRPGAPEALPTPGELDLGSLCMRWGRVPALGQAVTLDGLSLACSTRARWPEATPVLSTAHP